MLSRAAGDQQRWWRAASARVRHARRNNHKADEGTYALTVDSPKWDVIFAWPLASGNAVTKSCTKKQRLSINIASIRTVHEAVVWPLSYQQKNYQLTLINSSYYWYKFLTSFYYTR